MKSRKPDSHCVAPGLSGSADPARLLALMAPRLACSILVATVALRVCVRRPAPVDRRRTAADGCPASPVDQSAPAPSPQPTTAGPQAGNSRVAAAVRAWEGTITLPTYEEDPPDTNAPFDLFTTSRFNYPYTIRDRLTSRRVLRRWRTLNLENEYLRCSVLPDLGGHLYTCTDKVNGQDLFYANTAIKLANVAYRGAWAALGIEFNFPGVAQLDDGLAGGLPDRHQPGSERVHLGRQHRSRLRRPVARGAHPETAARRFSNSGRISTTRARGVTGSTGGPTPPCG